MQYWEPDHMDSAGAMVTTLGMQAFWTLVILAIIWAALAATRPNLHDARAQMSGTGGLDDVVRVLASRLTVGEIEAYEYRTKLQVSRSRDAS